MSKSISNITFAIIKPDVANCQFILNQVLDCIKQNEFQIINSKKTFMSKETAMQFYSQHKDKFFYYRLVTFMSSSPIYVLLLKKSNAIESWRSLIGKANVYRNIYYDPDCLRSKFGLTDTRNAFHGSDSLETVIQEASFFFSKTDIDNSFNSFLNIERCDNNSNNN